MPLFRRHVEIVFQRDLLEGGLGLDAHVPAAGKRQGTSSTCQKRSAPNVALRAKGSMPRSGRVRTSVASLTGTDCPPPTSVAAQSCRCRRAGRDQDLKHRAFGMDMDRKRRVGRHAEANQRGDNCDDKRTAGARIQGFTSSCRVTSSSCPSCRPSCPRRPGPCAPTPCTSSDTVTLPAFSNSSVTGNLSPCLSGPLRSSIIR